MREYLIQIEDWRKEGKSIALATNVKKEGSSLRPLGAKMIMTTSKDIAGSVSGGCVEGAIYDEAQEVIKKGVPKLVHFGVQSEEKPWEVGLTCGGTLDVFVERLDSPAWDEIYPALRTCLIENQLAALATVIAGPGLGNKLMLWPDGRKLGSLGSEEVDAQAQDWMWKNINAREPVWTSFNISGEMVEVYAEVYAPIPRMIVIGAVHIAVPLVQLAKAMGYYTIVIDPRSAFATRERFPNVDELIVEWPSDALEKLHLDHDTYIAALSHDEKLDNPALQIALASPASYIGVLGTSKRVPQRKAALREMGVPEEQLGRIRAPIGINLGSILPEEIALSILAEVVAIRRGALKAQGTQVEVKA
jgi:xanthine dehydrogenase accessory factor